MKQDRSLFASRRGSLIHLTAALGAFAAVALSGLWSSTAAAQAVAWPSKPIRVIVPYAAGGVVDVMARAVVMRMASELGQPIVVEAKPGANANIGADTVANAAADGYTWLISAPFLLNNPMLETGLRWKQSDFIPAARFALSPSYFVVPANSPAKSVQDYVEMARRSPGLQYGDGGTGSTQSMAIEMLKASTGIKLEPVMYKGAPPIVPDLVAGTLSMTVLPSTVAIPLIRTGKLRALANTSDKRSPTFPDVPTIAEAGYPEMTVLSWYGIHVPAGTPPEVVRRISDAAAVASAQSEVRERLNTAGGEIAYLSTTDFSAFIKEDQPRWARIVEAMKKGTR
ncbi:MAG: tripartite tricarboxylate transporter substrate binding protein [Burkholderiaceae bacterium]